jgi:hypothetical protein
MEQKGSVPSLQQLNTGSCPKSFKSSWHPNVLHLRSVLAHLHSWEHAHSLAYGLCYQYHMNMWKVHSLTLVF